MTGTLTLCFVDGAMCVLEGVTADLHQRITEDSSRLLAGQLPSFGRFPRRADVVAVEEIVTRPSRIEVARWVVSSNLDLHEVADEVYNDVLRSYREGTIGAELVIELADHVRSVAATLGVNWEVPRTRGAFGTVRDSNSRNSEAESSTNPDPETSSEGDDATADKEQGEDDDEGDQDPLSPDRSGG